MTAIVDVAAYILEQCGTMPTMKMQKLCYYAQARSYAVADKSLFDEDFKAWVNGPVSTELFSRHRGRFLADPGMFHDVHELSDTDKEICDWVIEKYGTWTGNQLSAKTHSEYPWKNQRTGLSPNERTSRVISKRDIREWALAHN